MKPPPKKVPGTAGVGSGATSNPLIPANPLKVTPPSNTPVKMPSSASPVITRVTSLQTSGDKKALQKPLKVGTTGKVTLSQGGPKVVNPVAQARKEAQEREKPAAEEEAKIEDKVFEILKSRDYSTPPLLHDFIEKIGNKLSLPRMSRTLLSEFASVDVTAARVSQVLKENPYYEFQFLKMFESMRKREEIPPTEGAMVLLGMQNSRNLVIALQLIRTIKGTHPEWDKDGKLKIKAADVLKYAIRTEDLLARDKKGFVNTAFAAGLIYDALVMIASELPDGRKKILPYIDQVYAHGLKSAQIAVQLSESMADFAFKKYIFSACLIHDVGKICLAILDPTYLTFIEEAGKKDLPRSIRHFTEQKRFKLDHAEIGSMVCVSFKVFKSIDKAILFHHDPYLLKSANKNLFQLASCICLASNMANNWRKPKDTADPLLAMWKGPELGDFKIDPKILVQSVQKLG